MSESNHPDETGMEHVGGGSLIHSNGDFEVNGSGLSESARISLESTRDIRDDQYYLWSSLHIRTDKFACSIDQLGPDELDELSEWLSAWATYLRENHQTINDLEDTDE